MSGLSTRRFAFEAFLPADKKERADILAELPRETRTMIIYEAPQHLVKTLTELYDVLGDRKISIVKELTKVHETNFTTSLSGALEFYKINEPRGEYVLVIEGADREAMKTAKEESFREMDLEAHMKMYTDQGMDRKEAMKAVAKDRGVPKREIYKALIREKEE